MYLASFILLIWTFIVVHCATSHALLVPSPPVLPSSAPQRRDVLSTRSIVQQNVAIAPPLPILEIGLQHILGQIGQNMTAAEKQTLNNDTRHPASSRIRLINKLESPAQCSATLPCVDGSCCNSEGKCGFTKYNCQNSASTACISNCNAKANCGMDSVDGAQKCALGLCCSYFGYCGTTDVFCTGDINPNHAPDQPEITFPCQQGFGSCKGAPPPVCNKGKYTASKGRKVGYWQSGNVKWRACNKVWPCQIDTTALTHLIYAFLFIDPKTYKVTPVDEATDVPLYTQFTSLKTRKLQTWIAVGGSSLNDPGTPTYTTFSDMSSTSENRAAFIVSIVAFMNQYGFQGVDLDWETPTIQVRGGKPVDFANIVQLVREMRAAFGTKYGISIAVPTDFPGLSTFDLIAMQPYLDFFNFMAYDIHGPWEAPRLGSNVRPQAALQDIQDRSIPLWFDGVDPTKVNLGLPYYGRGYTLLNLSCTDVGCPYGDVSKPGVCTGAPGILSLKEILDTIKAKGLIPKLIPESAQKEVTFDGNQWIAYDDAETIAIKEVWADEHCFGGTVAWSLDFIAGNGNPDPAQPLPPRPPPNNPSSNLADLTISKDGSCGQTQTCVGSIFGQCCSQYGYCGSTTAYCSVDNGCQTEYGLCGDKVPISAAPPSTSSSVPAPAKVSVDGSCGKDTSCLNSPFGNCCSSHSYCGNTDDYCSLASGCQPAFGVCGGNNAPAPFPMPTPLPPLPPPSQPLKTSIDGSCGNGVTCLNSGFGNCCSSHNYCGSSVDYCSVAGGCQNGFGVCGDAVLQPPPPPALKISIDGSCGNGVTCLKSTFGDCCSRAGYCGSSDDYCSPLNGCQINFGTCVRTAAGAMPGPPPATVPAGPKISVDGSCGTGITCISSTFGDCCSKHGFCGSSSAYCSVNQGCQPAFGTCAKAQKISIDGACGPDVTCQQSNFCDCCSSHGFCGRSDDYCAAANCQPASGVCH